MPFHARSLVPLVRARDFGMTPEVAVACAGPNALSFLLHQTCVIPKPAAFSRRPRDRARITIGHYWNAVDEVVCDE